MRVVHLEDKVSVLNVGLVLTKSAAVLLEALVVTLHPAAVIEGVKVVFPVEVEATSRVVILLHLDIVVLSIEGHAVVAEVVAPSFEGRSPEVHVEGLALSEESNVCTFLLSAHHVAVDEPLDVRGGPLDHVVVPFSAGLEASAVGMVLLLVLPDDVHAHRVGADGGDQLDVDLVPAFVSPVGSIPVGEEGGDCAHLVMALHTRAEATVLECLVGPNFSASVVGFGQRDEECCECGS